MNPQMFRRATILVSTIALGLLSSCANNTEAGEHAGSTAGPDLVAATETSEGADNFVPDRTPGVGPIPFDAAMEKKYLFNMSDLLDGQWNQLTDEQLLDVGQAYCGFRAEEERTTAAADSLAVLMIRHNVPINFDSTGRLDEREKNLASAVIVVAEGSLCSWFNAEIGDLDRPGTPALHQAIDIGEYVPAAGVGTDYNQDYISTSVRKRVLPSAERLYLHLLADFSSDLEEPFRVTTPNAEDLLLGTGYVSCVINDEAGLDFGRTALKHDLGFSIEQATLVSFAAGNYLCPEYLESIYSAAGAT